MAVDPSWAATRGARVTRLTLSGYAAGSVLTAVTVALTGPIGFVGLVVPHLVRTRIGADHRVLMPCAFLGGGILLAACDAIGRIVMAPSEVPAGAVMAILGGPYLVWVLAPAVDRMSRSPIAAIYDALRACNASWSVDIGRPSGPGWIADPTCETRSTGPFNELLLRIGERQRSADRMTIAASFALRYGWASAMAIAPYLKYGCVPDISLENISLKFKESTFFERTAIHEPRGVMTIATIRAASHPTITTVADRHELLRALRSALVAQAIARRRSAPRVVRLRAPRHVGHAHLVVGGAHHQPARRQPRSAPRAADPARLLRRRRRRRRSCSRGCTR